MIMKKIVCTVVVSFLAAAAANAMFMRADTEKVPIDRLIANLEAQLEKEPKNVQKRFALARVHAMAFFRGLTEMEVNKRDNLPWFGYCNGLEHFPKKKGGDSSANAQAHLGRAIAHLRQVTTEAADNALYHLGYAWCLDQAGKTADARTEYRKALELAWAKEKDQRGIGPCGSMTQELCAYLLPLLDADKDAKEIEKINDIKKDLAKRPRAITPIIVPLTGAIELAQLVNRSARVRFDLDGSGLPAEWQWITPKAGWLVFDHDGQGRITSGLQMFGNVTFWLFWSDGYEAMSALDNDANGKLEKDELTGLAIWRDANGNGVSEPGEVRPVSDWGIRALSCGGETHSSGIRFNPAGVEFSDGTARPTYDWIAETAGTAQR